MSTVVADTAPAPSRAIAGTAVPPVTYAELVAIAGFLLAPHPDTLWPGTLPRPGWGWDPTRTLADLLARYGVPAGQLALLVLAGSIPTTVAGEVIPAEEVRYLVGPVVQQIVLAQTLVVKARGFAASSACPPRVAARIVSLAEGVQARLDGGDLNGALALYDELLHVLD